MSTTKLYLWDIPVSQALKDAGDPNSWGEYGSEVIVTLGVNIVQARRRVTLMPNAPNWAKAWCQTHEPTDVDECGVYASYRE